MEEIEKLKFDLEIAKGANRVLSMQIKNYIECCKDVIPDKLFITKSRGNTTVKFRSGKSVTVKRKQGDKDCIETAIAYCIMKSILSPADIRKLIKEAIINE